MFGNGVRTMGCPFHHRMVINNFTRSIMNNFKFFTGVENEMVVWRTASGRHTPIEWMTTRHIKNVINCLNGEGEVSIPNPYFGKHHRDWMRIFTNELNNRDNQ